MSTFNGTLLQLCEMLQEKLHDLALHHFVATWQREQFVIILEAITHFKLVQITDFAQNLLLKGQDEPQVAH